MSFLYSMRVQLRPTSSRPPSTITRTESPDGVLYVVVFDLVCGRPLERAEVERAVVGRFVAAFALLVVPALATLLVRGFAGLPELFLI